MKYLTVKGFSEFQFEEKKSVFIGSVQRVTNESEVKKFIEENRNKYKDAKHHVFAYVYGEDKVYEKYSDDKEPQGTAGLPLLSVIKNNNLSDTIVVVSRIFGGVLLGASGLQRAYTKTAAEAIKMNKIIEKLNGFKITIEFSYDFFGKITYFCEKKNIKIINTIYDSNVSISFYLEESRSLILDELKNLTLGRCIMDISEKGFFLKEGDNIYKI